MQHPFVSGIYHAGIEVYGEAHKWGCLGEEEVTISCADDLSADHLDPFRLQEWSFQYFEDTWNDPSISGILRCMPKQMSGYWAD